MVSGSSLRSEWHLDPACTFLNHGSFGATPRVVLAEQHAWRERMERQPVRFLDSELGPLLRDRATTLAHFVGARGDDLVFLENATTGANAILASLEPQPGAELLTTNHVYPAVRLTLEHHARRMGATVVVAEVPYPIADSADVTAAIAARLSPRTRLVIVDHITSPTALIFPVAEIAALCRTRGVPLFVDGAHAPGMIPLDLPSIGCDYYTGNCHKWLFAAKGTAFLWVRPERQPGLHPPVISHGYGRGFAAEFDWTGTRDPSAWLSLPRAMAFHAHLGGEALARRNHDLALAGAHELAAAWGRTLPAPETMLGSMAAVLAPAGFAATQEGTRALNGHLRHVHGIEVPVISFAGQVWIRVSAQAYNHLAEYRRLAEAVLRSIP